MHSISVFDADQRYAVRIFSDPKGSLATSRFYQFFIEKEQKNNLLINFNRNIIRSLDLTMNSISVFDADQRYVVRIFVTLRVLWPKPVLSIFQ